MEWVLTEHAEAMVELRRIGHEWIDLALASPDGVAQDLFDPRLYHALRVIPEADNRILRVIYNATVSPVAIVTVFFDRRERRRRESRRQ
jgi:hypothetical protein